MKTSELEEESEGLAEALGCFLETRDKIENDVINVEEICTRSSSSQCHELFDTYAPLTP